MQPNELRKELFAKELSAAEARNKFISIESRCARILCGPIEPPNVGSSTIALRKPLIPSSNDGATVLPCEVSCHRGGSEFRLTRFIPWLKSLNAMHAGTCVVFSEDEAHFYVHLRTGRAAGPGPASGATRARSRNAATLDEHNSRAADPRQPQHKRGRIASVDAPDRALTMQSADASPTQQPVRSPANAQRSPGNTGVSPLLGSPNLPVLTMAPSLRKRPRKPTRSNTLSQLQPAPMSGGRGSSLAQRRMARVASAPALPRLAAMSDDDDDDDDGEDGGLARPQLLPSTAAACAGPPSESSRRGRGRGRSVPPRSPTHDLDAHAELLMSLAASAGVGTTACDTSAESSGPTFAHHTKQEQSSGVSEHGNASEAQAAAAAAALWCHGLQPAQGGPWVAAGQLHGIPLPKGPELPLPPNALGVLVQGGPSAAFSMSRSSSGALLASCGDEPPLPLALWGGTTWPSLGQVLGQTLGLLHELGMQQAALAGVLRALAGGASISAAATAAAALAPVQALSDGWVWARSALVTHVLLNAARSVGLLMPGANGALAAASLLVRVAAPAASAVLLLQPPAASANDVPLNNDACLARLSALCPAVAICLDRAAAASGSAACATVAAAAVATKGCQETNSQFARPSLNQFYDNLLEMCSSLSSAATQSELPPHSKWALNWVFGPGIALLEGAVSAGDVQACRWALWLCHTLWAEAAHTPPAAAAASTAPPQHQTQMSAWLSPELDAAARQWPRACAQALWQPPIAAAAQVQAQLLVGQQPGQQLVELAAERSRVARALSTVLLLLGASPDGVATCLAATSSLDQERLYRLRVVTLPSMLQLCHQAGSIAGSSNIYALARLALEGGLGVTCQLGMHAPPAPEAAGSVSEAAALLMRCMLAVPGVVVMAAPAGDAAAASKAGFGLGERGVALLLQLQQVVLGLNLQELQAIAGPCALLWRWALQRLEGGADGGAAEDRGSNSGEAADSEAAAAKRVETCCLLAQVLLGL